MGTVDHRVPAFRVGEIDQPRVLIARSRPGVVVVRADLGDETVAECVPLRAVDDVALPIVAGRPLHAPLDDRFVLARDRMLDSPFSRDELHGLVPETPEDFVPAYRIHAVHEEIMDDVRRAASRNSGRIACSAGVVIAPDGFDMGMLLELLGGGRHASQQRIILPTSSMKSESRVAEAAGPSSGCSVALLP